MILAAGGSTRMGSPKQLILHDGKPLVTRAAAAASGAGLDPVIVVLGSDAGKIAAALAELPEVISVVNHSWKSGIASSLALGISTALDCADCDGVLVLLADQPLVDAAAVARLVHAFSSEARIAASGYGNVIGVPALFGREHLPALMRLTGDDGAGPWLRDRLKEVVVVPLESAALDLDTPADVERLAGNRGSR